jgi:16S rRNA (guanine(966)-N(2))-methyltransferase RsmD
MRIIAGELKGRRLRAPDGTGTRPTSDRVREALFDVLSRTVEGSRFLDVYAGSGAVGIEALSRGASLSVFVESGPRALDVLESNLSALRLTGRSRVLKAPFVRAAATLAKEGEPFDLIFVDPPYGTGEILRSLRLVSSMRLLRPEGTLIAEHDSKLRLPEREGDLAVLRSLRYGGTSLSLFRHLQAAGG